MTEKKKQRALQLIKDHTHPSKIMPHNKTQPTIQITGSYVHISSRDTYHHTHIAASSRVKLSAEGETEKHAHLAEIARLQEAVFLLENQATSPKKPQSVAVKIAWIVKRIRRAFTEDG